MNDDNGDQRVSSSNSSINASDLSKLHISPEDMDWVLNETKEQHLDESMCLAEEENDPVHHLTPLQRQPYILKKRLTGLFINTLNKRS